MSDRTGLGVVEVAVLDVLDRMGARPDRPHQKSAKAILTLANERGVSWRYGYDALCAMTQPWMVHIALVDGHGNFGSPDTGDPPANPRYTEARLSAAGALALAAERGEISPLPVGVINGTMYVDGLAPPFAPTRVVDALLALCDRRDLPDDDVIKRVGPPMFPTGCDVKVDEAELVAGEPTDLVMSARLHIGTGASGREIEITNFPYGLGAEDAGRALAARVNAGARGMRADAPAHLGELALPLKDLRNESTAEDALVVCVVRPDADVDACARQVANTWGVFVRRSVQLPAPLPQMLRSFLDDDAAAQRAALTALLRALPGRAG